MTTELQSRMRELLHNTFCEVTFTKVNGDTRTGTFTTNQNYITENVATTEKVTDRVVSEKDGVIRAVDTNLNEWRSFIVDKVTSFSYLDTYSNVWLELEI
jgi:N-acetyl-beta-hexosaminidase